MQFKDFMEANDPKMFLSTAMEKFPDTTDLLVLADSLDDDGEENLANVIRDFITNRKTRDSNGPEWHRYVDRAKEELKKSGIFLLQDSIKMPDESEYGWYGNVVVKRDDHGHRRMKVINLEDIEDPNVIKGLAVLAAEFFSRSYNAHYGLEDFKTTKGNLSKEGEKQRLQESELRYAINWFLIYFGQFEEIVLKFSRIQRQRWDDQNELRKLISYNGYGYLWEIPITTEIITRFVKQNGSTPFLKRLSARLAHSLSLAYQVMRDGRPDNRMVEDLRKIIEVINK